MNPQAEALKERTKNFAVRILRMWRHLPQGEEARVVGRQLLRSGTSVAANYRAACRARSKAEFISKLGTVVEEMDETAFWLELMVAAEILPSNRLKPLQAVAGELLAIFVSSQLTAKSVNAEIRKSENIKSTEIRAARSGA
jgi:four helix bundle protein